MYKNLSIISTVTILLSCKHNKNNNLQNSIVRHHHGGGHSNSNHNNNSNNSSNTNQHSSQPKYNPIISFQAINFRKIDDNHFEQLITWESKESVKLNIDNVEQTIASTQVTINGEEKIVQANSYLFKGDFGMKYTATLSSGDSSNTISFGEPYLFQDLQEIIHELELNKEYVNERVLNYIVSKLQDERNSLFDKISNLINVLDKYINSITSAIKLNQQIFNNVPSYKVYDDLKKYVDELKSSLDKIKVSKNTLDTLEFLKGTERFIKDIKNNIDVDINLKQFLEFVSKNYHSISNFILNFENQVKELRSIFKYSYYSLSIKNNKNTLDTFGRDDLKGTIDDLVHSVNLASNVKNILHNNDDKPIFDKILKGEIKIEDLVDVFTQLLKIPKYNNITSNLNKILNILSSIKLNGILYNTNMKDIVNEYGNISNNFSMEATIHSIKLDEDNKIILNTKELDEDLNNITFDLLIKASADAKAKIDSKVSNTIIKDKNTSKILKNYISYFKIYKDIGANFFNVSSPNIDNGKYINDFILDKINILNTTIKGLENTTVNQTHSEDMQLLSFIGNYLKKFQYKFNKLGWLRLVDFINSDINIKYTDIGDMVTKLNNDVNQFFITNKYTGQFEYAFKDDISFDLMILKLKFLKIESIFQEVKDIIDSNEKETLQKKIDTIRKSFNNSYAK